MKTTFIGKGIRIDIYAKDSDGNVYDIEMQTTEETDLHLRRHVRKIRKVQEISPQISIFRSLRLPNKLEFFYFFFSFFKK